MSDVDRHPPGTFCWVELATTEQEAAKAFYASLFGWSTEDNPVPPNDFYTIFVSGQRFAAGAYTLRPEQRSQHVAPHWMLYVAVESADDAAARTAKLGGRVLASPSDVDGIGRMAVLQDPTGAAFSVWQAKLHQGIGVAGVEGTLCWADLVTPDPARASRFYCDLFSWTIKADENDPSGYLHIQSGDRFIGGIPPSRGRDPISPYWLVYFAVTDCGQSVAKAKQLGARLMLPPTSMEDVGRWAVLADPQGAAFAMFEPPRPC